MNGGHIHSEVNIFPDKCLRAAYTASVYAKFKVT